MDDNLRWKGGKSHHKYFYTVQDIATITERAEGTIRNDASAGRLNLGDLLSVSKYCTKWSVCKEDTEKTGQN